MTLIQHKKGNVRLPKYGISFPPGKAVEIGDEHLAEKILRNADFFKPGSAKTKKTERRKTK